MATATQTPDGSWEIKITVSNEQYWELVRFGSWAEKGPAESAEVFVRAEVNEKLREHSKRQETLLKDLDKRLAAL